MTLQVGRSLKLTPIESELVQQAKHGEMAAFQEIFEHFKSPVYNFVLRMIGQPEDAEDVVQNVFVKVYQKFHLLRDTGYFSTWLFSIAKNEAINHSKRQQRKRHDSIEKYDDRQQNRLSGQQNNNPETESVRGDMEHQVQIALEQVPETYRAAFVLGVLEGYSYKEVAKILGCSVNNVKSRVFRARALLTEKLKPYFNIKG